VTHLWSDTVLDGPDKADLVHTMREQTYEILHTGYFAQNRHFLYQLYGVLLERGCAAKGRGEYHNVLISLRTPYLEEFFEKNFRNWKEFIEQGGDYGTIQDVLPHFDLFWCYFIKGGKHSHAARVLFYLATEMFTTSPKLIVFSISDRYQYLLKAKIQSEKSTDLSGVTFALGDTIRDRIALANIQMEVDRELRENGSGREVEQGMEKKLLSLNKSLLTANELYVNYAKPYRLYSVQLQLIHFSHQENAHIIEQLWSKVLRQPNRWTIVSVLGRVFDGPGPVFPLAFLCGMLEKDKDGEISKVIDLMRSIGVTYSELFFNVYHNLAIDQRSGLDPQDLSATIIYLLEKWIYDVRFRTAHVRDCEVGVLQRVSEVIRSYDHVFARAINDRTFLNLAKQFDRLIVKM
jgi:hypothetical protein